MEQPVSSREAHARTNVFNRFVDRRPYVGAVILLALLLVMLLCALAVQRTVSAHSTTLSYLQKIAISETLLTLMVVILISVLGWWKDAGFTRWSTQQGIIVCIFPFAITVLPILCAAPLGVLNAPLITDVTAVACACMVGFVEEGFFRGLLVRALLPKGIVLSVILSSVMFACFHLFNLISAVPLPFVAIQLVIALGSGVLFAALRLRAVSIWPTILLHALHDLPSLILLGVNHKMVFNAASPASLAVNGILSLIFIVYAVFLLRPRHLAELSIVYGLVDRLGSDETVGK